MTEREITVIDFTHHTVRRMPISEAKREWEEECRNNGHYFQSVGKPKPETRCVCGDITLKEWLERK